MILISKILHITSKVTTRGNDQSTQAETQADLENLQSTSPYHISQ